MSIMLSQKYRPSAEVLFQELNGEGVLLDLASESYFGLDPVGAKAWALLDGRRTLADISAILAEDYAQPLDTVSEDIAELASALLDAGLVVAAD